MFNGANEFYSSEREYIFALAEALRDEYMEIYKAGLIVQVDDAVVGLNSDLPFMRGQCVGARGVGATIFRGE